MDYDFEHYLVEVRELLERGDRDDLRALLDEMRFQDIAFVFMELRIEDLPMVFNLLASGRRVDVFSHLDPDYQYRLITRLPEHEAHEILSRMDPDDLTALLEDLPKDEVRRLLRLLPFRTIRRALTLLGYPEDSVGRMMSPQFVAVRSDMSVGDALESIREQSEQGRPANTIFVVDADGRLSGIIPLKHFVLGKPEDDVTSLAAPPVATLHPEDRQQAAAEAMQHYDLEVLPVIDQDGELVGTITVDDVLDMVEEETTEDFHKMGSVGMVGLSLRDANPWLLFRKRIGWLLVLIAVGLLGGSILSGFEDVIESVVVLVFFLPMVIASGGNAGAQSSTLMVRALAVGDVHARDWVKLWTREFAVSAALGVTLGLAVAALGLWRGGMTVAFVVGLAMLLIVVISSLIGVLLPFLLSRFRLDPATASAPLITSISDIMGILIYFSLAVALLNIPGPA
ncbi:MAG: magnesium transporter [Chromatiales bacterium]|jgi:magnesium transporter|nr:magnesium transporter [Chromatiales bacterium]MDX9767341.1 magnesium transporter [Ectothiorhodospiraceae bacterium]